MVFECVFVVFEEFGSSDIKGEGDVFIWFEVGGFDGVKDEV